jgi:copper resistance protein D
VEDLALPAVRFLHYAAALQLFGVAVFQLLLAPAGLRRQLDRAAARVAVPSAWLLVGTALGWLAGTTAGMGSGWADAFNPDVLALVLTATAFGRVWAFEIVISILLAVVLSAPRWRGTWLLSALLSGLALASLGLVGHAATGEGMLGFLNRASQAIHLLASGFWVGSLLPLLFCLKALGDPDHEGAAQTALHRFSGFGHLAVALVIATGLINGWLIMGGPPWAGTAYQWLLLSKVVVVLVMISLAIVNRYVFVPAMQRGGLARLRLGTIAEMILTALVLALVSWLGTLPPT